MLPDLAVGLMESAQIVVCLCQEMPVACPARLLANQQVQVVDRLLQDLSRFGRLSTVKVEIPQIKVRVCEIVTDAGRIDSEGREREVGPGPGGTRGFASQSILDCESASIDFLDLLIVTTGFAVRIAEILKALRQVPARGSLQASRAQAIPAGPKSDSSPRLRVHADCSIGA